MLKHLSRLRPTPSMVVSVISAIVALGSAGYAATGGTFLLGMHNTADHPTTLSGQFGAPLVELTNAFTGKGVQGTALSLRVNRGEPPLAVNSNTRVPNFNADLLDGYDANSLTRVARAYRSDLPPVSNFPFSDQLSIAIKAPKAGFVLVNAHAEGIGTTNCSNCPLEIYVRDDKTGAISMYGIAMLAGSLALAQSTSTSWVFPVTPGNRTFTLVGGVLGNASNFAVEVVVNPVLTALFVPFGPNGNLNLADNISQAAPLPLPPAIAQALPAALKAVAR